MNLGPCANCGKEQSARMGNSEWGHGAMCCSSACGERLQIKIRNGMAEPPASIYGAEFDDGESWRVAAMRIRIKVLEARLKAAATPNARRDDRALDTYEKPAHGWTCFHCGETFTTVGAARTHFGAEQTAEPGCMVKVALGGERGLLMALRKAEETIARYMNEDTDLHRALYRLQSQQSDALRDAEEAGYARGLRDGLHMTPDERAKVLSND